MSMNIHMNFLRSPADFRAILSEDGWVILAAEKNDEVDATHPQVADEDAARIRLHRLGLLTSRALRIEFRRGKSPTFTDRKRPGTNLDPREN
jgi:hypothetical protein